MKSSISRSIQAMEEVIACKSTPLWIYIDKDQGCLATTPSKEQASPMYEVADWVQWLTNSETTSSNVEVKRLHALFQRMWEGYISEISLSR